VAGRFVAGTTAVNRTGRVPRVAAESWVTGLADEIVIELGDRCRYSPGFEKTWRVAFRKNSAPEKDRVERELWLETGESLVTGRLSSAFRQRSPLDYPGRGISIKGLDSGRRW
jgi:hypothetical protein